MFQSNIVEMIMLVDSKNIWINGVPDSIIILKYNIGTKAINIIVKYGGGQRWMILGLRKHWVQLILIKSEIDWNKSSNTTTHHQSRKNLDKNRF